MRALKLLRIIKAMRFVRCAPGPARLCSVSGASAIEPKGGAVPKRGPDKFRDIADAREGSDSLAVGGLRRHTWRELADSCLGRPVAVRRARLRRGARGGGSVRSCGPHRFA